MRKGFIYFGGGGAAAVFIVIAAAVVVLQPGYNYDYTFETVLERQFVHHTHKVKMDQTFDAYLTANDVLRLQKSEQLRDGLRLERNPFSKLDENFRAAMPDTTEKSVVVYPLFTAAAYSEPGYYTFFRGEVGEEYLTVSFENPRMGYTSSGMGTQVLHLLGYEVITDVQVDLHPEILAEYDEVILLHNEYITKTMYDAFMAHPKLIHLYPNAIYAEVSVDYGDETVTLIGGHKYPNHPNGPSNWFDYKAEIDFHKYEYDAECLDWEFGAVEKGWHLNCYPDAIKPAKMLEIFQKMKEL